MIRLVIDGYIVLLIADAILSYIPASRHWLITRPLKQAANFSLSPVRKLLPGDLPVDLSPVVVILGLNVLKALW